MIQRELQLALAPLQKSTGRLERGVESLGEIRRVTGQLKPLLGQQGRMVALQHAQAVEAPARKVKAPAAKAPVAAPPAKKRGRPARSTGAQACAVIGCKRPARSKGYCSAHYQKLRLLVRTNRRPADWKDDAAPQSAREVKLPRGRAAARERTPEPAKPREAPKPKAWVRKKGSPGMVSLH
ncbi:cell wall protein [Hyalangium rubrum]|uniref:Cell wall protein n=1 Tax=Hyalangium rubrum TaxID=3103134 RepID=A0ABU5HF10_9BACT|nr:cell wall protein [Hyalangium sp. s54d21]MDY7231388.1 cell wall protein [Hyalangium sp. s54d21]